MAMSLCISHESNIFGAGDIFDTDACHIFPPCVLTIIPSLLLCPEPALDVIRASDCLCGCLSLAGGRI